MLLIPLLITILTAGHVVFVLLYVDSMPHVAGNRDPVPSSVSLATEPDRCPRSSNWAEDHHQISNVAMAEREGKYLVFVDGYLMSPTESRVQTILYRYRLFLN